MKYILIGQNAVKVDDTLMWARWMEWMSINGARHVGNTRIPARKPLKKSKITRKGPRRISNRALTIINKHRTSKVHVSTVFLGIDHAFLGPSPVLFETMIFGGKYNEYKRRYQTFNEALKGHQQTLGLLK